MTSDARVTVRQATAGDLETVVALRVALLREYGDHPTYGRLRSNAEQLARPVFALQLDAGNEATFLAEIDGAPIGIIRCVETAASPLLIPDRYCYVSSAYVRPDQRRHGVLRALLARATDWCWRRGLTEMRLHNVGTRASAVAAWDSTGFEVVEQVRVRRIPAGGATAAATTNAVGASTSLRP
ncbi:MAG: GNAT family N-acetyltransferase [Gemmatimonadaceae bacterium]